MRPSAEAEQLGALAHAPVWEEVEARIRAEGTYLPGFYVYLVIAGVIGVVGILTNSQILIVAATVVGPECGAITSVALGMMSAAAKMVVTEMKTPSSALVLACVRETIPTMPTSTATTTEKKLGASISLETGLMQRSNALVWRPKPRPSARRAGRYAARQPVGI